MAQVTVIIDEKSYRLACEDGQEAHLVGLAKQVEDKLKLLKTSVGEIGDMRLLVMASIMLADECSELRGRIDKAEAERSTLQQAVRSEAEELEAREMACVAAVDAAAAKVQKITDALSS